LLGKWAVAALVVAGVGVGAHPASALVAIPDGTPDGSANDLLTLSGTYSAPLPSPLAQPFAAPDFTLSFVVPAQVSVSAAGPVVSEFGLQVSGSYTNDGVVTIFTNQRALFGTGNTALATSDFFTFIGADVLQQRDSFLLSLQSSAPLFSPAIFGAGEPETFMLGSFDVVVGSASYNTDPGFTGTVSISSMASEVPEPASLGLVLPALAGLWLAHRGLGLRKSC
jgi:hypothetical protein